MTTTTLESASFRYAPLYWLALGTFAIGTEGFMIAAILPKMAEDLKVSLQAAGQLIAIFSLTYALSSPVLTALTGRIDRRPLLITAMIAFIASNLLAAGATNYNALVAARMLLALSAGLYVPGASALAGALAPPEKRGKALAIITGGVSVAVALGVPVGALLGTQFGWRMTFVGVAGLSTIALLGLIFGMPKGVGKGLPVASLRERLAVAIRPSVLAALLVTTLWAMGSYTAYTFIAPYLSRVAQLDGNTVGTVLFAWGLAAILGLALSGAATDRLGSNCVVGIALPILLLSLASLSVIARIVPAESAIVPVLGAVAVWGLSHWGFFPAQQARLIAIAGPQTASITLSLNASFMYIGFALGSVTGAYTLSSGSVSDIGWVGATAVLGSYLLFRMTRTRN